MIGQEGPLVETVDLTKRYGDLTAVDHLNLKVEKGTIFGLLGPNGAGKTTTILMLLGLTEPTSGKALVAGHDVIRNPLLVKSMVGYLPDNVGFYQELSGRQNLRYTAALNGIKGNSVEENIERVLARVDLRETADRKVGEYSRGMRQRLGIADVLLKNPQLIILDEPTLGIDPEGVRDLLALIRGLAEKDGKTVLISSHLLHQVQQICDRVGIFVKGRLIASGSIEELGKQLVEEDTFRVELKAEPDGEELVNLCRSMDGVTDVQRQGDLLILLCTKDIGRALAQRLVTDGYRLLHLHFSGFFLEDIYRRYFQKEGYYGQGSQGINRQ